MPQGDKGKYTDKQKRMERHIEEGYEKRGVGKDEPQETLGWDELAERLSIEQRERRLG